MTEPSDSPPPCILVVEDEIGIAELNALMVKRAGYEADTAITGSTALKKIAERDYALMLVDLGLPDMDGTEVIRATRAMGKTFPIVVTGSASYTVRGKIAYFTSNAYSLHIENDAFDEVLRKPFSPHELQELVARLLGKPPSEEN